VLQPNDLISERMKISK